MVSGRFLSELALGFALVIGLGLAGRHFLDGRVRDGPRGGRVAAPGRRHSAILKAAEETSNQITKI